MLVLPVMGGLLVGLIRYLVSAGQPFRVRNAMIAGAIFGGLNVAASLLSVPIQLVAGVTAIACAVLFVGWLSGRLPLP